MDQDFADISGRIWLQPSITARPQQQIWASQRAGRFSMMSPADFPSNMDTLQCRELVMPPTVVACFCIGFRQVEKFVLILEKMCGGCRLRDMLVKTRIGGKEIFWRGSVL